MADLREAILARIDDWAGDHQPCPPDTACMHRAVDALRMAVEIHHVIGGSCVGCGGPVECPELVAVGAVIGVIDRG